MKQVKVEDLRIIDIPKITDPRGNLSVIENDIIPFKIKRIYYLFDVPSGSYRGGHAHKKLTQFVIALSGSFDIIVRDQENIRKITLNNPTKGLLIIPGIWREIENFSSGAICLVVASEVYDEDDYIRDFKEFLSYNTIKE